MPQRPLKTVAVDLTPVLPGGENGGAKVFVLQLVRDLAAAAPQLQFVLLTQAASHDELARLDAPNVRRVMAVGPAAAGGRRRLFEIASRVMRRFPHVVRRRVAALGYRVHALIKRRGDGLVAREGAGLLFCPFTAPTYREGGTPVVCTIYDLQYAAYPQFFSVEDATQRERAFADAARHGTRLAAISEFTRQSAIGHGADAARIRAVPLRMRQDAAHAAPGDLPQRLGLQPRSYLLYPANFWKHKNHEMLLTAFAIAARGGLPAAMKLVCTGAPGSRMEWLRASAHAMGLGERVLFPGFVGEAEYAALLQGARALVFPSLYEGFGMPLIEAMAAGIPVACGNLTALPETAGGAALLFDPRDPVAIAAAMEELASDEAVARRWAALGRLRAQDLADAGRMTHEYLELFAEAFAAGGRAP
jgi:glycosyltransferase involved in cell wall biosynthesis